MHSDKRLLVNIIYGRSVVDVRFSGLKLRNAHCVPLRDLRGKVGWINARFSEPEFFRLF